MEQFLYAINAGCGLLQVFNLLADVFQWLGQHADVEHDQVSSADAHLLLTIQVCPESQSHCIPDHIESIGAGERQVAHHSSNAVRFEHTPHQLVEAKHHIGFGSCSTNVFRTRDALFQEAICFGSDLPLGSPPADRNVLQQAQGDHRQQAIDCEPCSHAPVLAEQQQQNANNQDSIPHYLDYEL